jgi:hypothetical protein
MSRFRLLAVIASFGVVGLAHSANIIGVSTPISWDSESASTAYGSEWLRESATGYTGVGIILNPEYTPYYDHDDHHLQFAKHAHSYLEPYIPDPRGAQVTYLFDSPVIVNSLRMIEHGNGVTRVQAFVGNSLDSMVSIGNVFGAKGDQTGYGVFGECEENLFSFVNEQSAVYLQIVFTKTSLDHGYAMYRAYPEWREPPSVPEPEGGLVLLALLGLATVGVVGVQRNRTT